MAKRKGDEVFIHPEIGQWFWYDGGDYTKKFQIVWLTERNVYYEERTAGSLPYPFAMSRSEFATKAKHVDYHGGFGAIN